VVALSRKAACRIELNGTFFGIPNPGHAIIRVVSDEDDDDEFHAADEPTAMWDAASLQELGLDIPPLEQKETGPATTGTGAHRAIGVELTAAPAAKEQGSQVMQWVVTIVLAVGLGVGVFFLVRMFR
jgi:hypothetical protein